MQVQKMNVLGENDSSHIHLCLIKILGVFYKLHRRRRCDRCVFTVCILSLLLGCRYQIVVLLRYGYDMDTIYLHLKTQRYTQVVPVTGKIQFHHLAQVCTCSLTTCELIL